MFDEFQYVVRFPNGKYFSPSFYSSYETDDLKYASKYTFDWQPMKDLYLRLHCEENNLTYELVKIRTIYEIVEVRR